ncbi:peptidase M48 Ste24p [Pirellula staleyi DSM 6068]|uniref:Peptidase M48 Ste24p n=1 Tax=Pirellula staleyi (strain ATCC 27377 / DSM 6068 / ICPB 4128) TaxID=530564 RepID=D2QXF4_PIRSD|nr:M48 family metallopeptidase [Pirellula staleyi]ADB16139.1 peptidase M48 Ste24p [Pirellula staleyi DSM 6068]
MNIPRFEPLSQQLVPSTTPAHSFASLSPGRYRHHQDEHAMSLLRESAGFGDLVRVHSELFTEYQMRAVNLATNLRVSEKQFPSLHELFRHCCRTLGVYPYPDFFIGYGTNAWTAGVETPHVVIGGGLVESLSREELQFVIGHELGHILFKHVYFQQIGVKMLGLVDLIPVVGGIVKSVAFSQLMHFIRSAEYSADRAGLLACDSFDAAMQTLLRLMRFSTPVPVTLNLDACLEQARELSEEFDSNMTSMLRGAPTEHELTHPWPIRRVKELDRWIREEGYQKLRSEAVALAQQSVLLLEAPQQQAVVCSVCKTPLTSSDRFCFSCGAPLRSIKTSSSHPGEESSK